ncbi:DUF1810 family protein [Capnocytophaga canimorsus]|nr:DUF1810 family protein [Capnocytophaga canimorsus]WGU71153.1 DUF1810 family protein [Capnocytophaga canimorsus]
MKSGRKKGRWMWYVFPQFKCLALSESSKSYGIDSVDEAEAFFASSRAGNATKGNDRCALKPFGTRRKPYFWLPPMK